jgi:hypothetical protein
MTRGQRTKVLGATMTFAGVALGLMLVRSPGVQARGDEDNDEASLIRRGFEIAPVHLNLEGKNRALVGLGSFIVNGQSDCNGCHTAGGPPNFNYAAGGNPYFLEQGPTKTDPTTYLAGGTDFGLALPPGFYDPGYGDYVGPDIITRNLTPDKTGRPEGGNTLAQFKEIMRKGTDFDHLHPNCTTVSATPSPANCIPAPVDGSRLQIMPWPLFAQMTDHQIEAIYEYLSAIPCIAGPATPSDLPPALQYAFPVLHNDCGDPPLGSQKEPSRARRSAKP